MVCNYDRYQRSRVSNCVSPFPVCDASFAELTMTSGGDVSGVDLSHERLTPLLHQYPTAMPLFSFQPVTGCQIPVAIAIDISAISCSANGYTIAAVLYPHACSIF